MKFSKPVLILSAAGLGLTFAYSQQSNSEAQQKALDILHQQLAGQQTAGQPKAAPAPAPAPAATTAPTKDQLLADIERLHDERKISDQQYASFKKNINEQYAGPASTSQTQALVQQALAQKIQQLKTGEATPAQPVVAQAATKSQPAPAAKPVEPATVKPAAAAASNNEAQAKAQKVLDEQLAQQRASQQAKAAAAEPKAPAKVATAAPAKAVAPAPAPAPARAVAPAPVVVAAAAAAAAPPPRTQERTNVIPATASTSLSPQQEAQAREALRQKIAEANSQNVRPKPAATSAPAAAAATAAATTQAAPKLQPAPAKPVAPPAAPAVVAQSRPAAVPAATPAPAAQPAPNSEAQTQSLAVLREYEMGIPPGTQELVRILRVKEAELNGTITAEEASRIPLPTKFYGPSPWAAAATSPKTEIPVATKNKEGLARLSELNDMYRSNLISPADYQQQRAKIISSL